MLGTRRRRNEQQELYDCLVSTFKRTNNMEASNNTKNPSSLYKQCILLYVEKLNYNVTTMDRMNIIRLLPGAVLADIYSEMSSNSNLKKILLEELSDLTVFSRIIKFGPARQKMFKCFSSLMSNGQPIASELRTKYVLNSKLFLSEEYSKQPDKEYLGNIDTGLRLGTFLAESGWLEESLNVLTQVLLLIERLDYDYTTLIIELDCLQRLLHAQATFCCFKEAATTQTLALDIVDKIGVERVPNCLLANLYIQISVLHFSRSEYDLSYSWSVKALKKLKQNTPDKIVVDVLRQAAKSCVVKRHFKRANMLITLAVKRAKKVFGKNHQKYADALLDNGFFLLNVDSIVNSVNIYKDALVIRRQIFGIRNFHVAVAHEDLAYALYVHEYSSGRFQTAREHVVKAIDIMKDLVPCNHLMLASAKRVKALILEEIALDNMASQNIADFDGLLIESEELHQSALQLSLEAFGEINVQTAKHYGNLGRLYQSMTKFKDAEDMHKKAIKIKTDLLGAYDYEVGLSIGHLASLYNYHMKKHRDAEELYLRSITISLRLFGKTYSGLEYDYRGLCHVYESLHDTDKYLEYSLILESWRLLREENDQGSETLYDEFKEDTSMEEVTKKFFEMCAETEIITAG